MKEVIMIGVILLILGFAVYYIISQKKKGKKCIGCPYCKKCSGNCHQE